MRPVRLRSGLLNAGMLVLVVITSAACPGRHAGSMEKFDEVANSQEFASAGSERGVLDLSKNETLQASVRELARAPTEDLRHWFQTIDERRVSSGKQAGGDFLLARVITVLAFEDIGTTNRADKELVARLNWRVRSPSSSRLEFSQASWPWKFENGEWKLEPVAVWITGLQNEHSYDVLPAFDWYVKNCPRRKF